MIERQGDRSGRRGSDQTSGSTTSRTLRYGLPSVLATQPKGGASALRGPGSMTWSPIEDAGHRLDDFVDLSPALKAERTVPNGC